MSNLLLRLGCYLIYLSARMKNTGVIIEVHYMIGREHESDDSKRYN